MISNEVLKNFLSFGANLRLISLLQECIQDLQNTFHGHQIQDLDNWLPYGEHKAGFQQSSDKLQPYHKYSVAISLIAENDKEVPIGTKNSTTGFFVIKEFHKPQETYFSYAGVIQQKIDMLQQKENGSNFVFQDISIPFK